MTRPTKDDVDACLSYEAETRCAEIEPDVYRILAAEVRALREMQPSLTMGQIADGITKAVIQNMRDEIAGLREAATDFVEHREEATSRIWYVSGDRGRRLLEVLGIEYVEKE